MIAVSCEGFTFSVLLILYEISISKKIHGAMQEVALIFGGNIPFYEETGNVDCI